MEKRQERMLEEVLKLPGNNACADCRATAPRWASVNLGIFLCVSCASIHRKMGTHTSRVKSVTLDTWTREQITSMRSIGNTASNAKYNPDGQLPPAVHSDERDSEMEKYIRQKYERKAFMVKAAAPARGPTNPWQNRRNPELNDIIVPEKALPGLPESISHLRPSPTPAAPPRLRPSPTPSRSSSIQNLVNAGGVVGPPLIDLHGASSSTLPLQMAPQQSYTTQQSPQYLPMQQYPAYAYNPFAYGSVQGMHGQIQMGMQGQMGVQNMQAQAPWQGQGGWPGQHYG